MASQEFAVHAVLDPIGIRVPYEAISDLDPNAYADADAIAGEV